MKSPHRSPTTFSLRRYSTTPHVKLSRLGFPIFVQTPLYALEMVAHQNVTPIQLFGIWEAPLHDRNPHSQVACWRVVTVLS